MSGESAAFGPGTVIGHFTIDEEIGSGAMGAVFLGTDRRDNSRVAIKVMNAELTSDSAFRQRFEREAHLATLLKSPYTVRVLDFGRSAGSYFIVMEYVEGRPVGEMLRPGPLPLDQALEIATDTARALEAAATQNIVHLDLKPNNIIVSADGAAKLVDFGIAQQSTNRNTRKAFAGTVHYAAPEQQMGEIDHRTDIYSLGATLFHMLVGRPPYIGSNEQDVLRQHLQAPFPAPLLSWQPEPVVDLVRRCMQKDPADRYQTASELAAALERLRGRLEATGYGVTRGEGLPPNLVPEPEEPVTNEPVKSGTIVLAPRQPTPVPLPPPQAPASSEIDSGTVVFPMAGGTTRPPVSPAPVAAPPASPPPSNDRTDVAAPPPPFLPDAVRTRGRGPGLLIGVAALIGVLLIGGVAAFALLSGGDDSTASADLSPTPAVTSTVVSGAGSATASASATTTASATASASATVETARPETPTATPAPVETPTPVVVVVPPTPTPPRPTTPPATPTPAPAAGLSVVGFASSGFSGGGLPGGRVGNGGTLGCSSGAIYIFINYSAGMDGATIGGQWLFNGAPTSVSTGSQRIDGNGPGTIQFSFSGVPLQTGRYSFTASGGGASTSGSVQTAC